MEKSTLFFCILLLLSLAQRSQAQNQKQPNFILIFADDLG